MLLTGCVPTCYYTPVNSTNQQRTWQINETPSSEKSALGLKKSSTQSSKNTAKSAIKTCQKSSETTSRNSQQKSRSARKTTCKLLSKSQQEQKSSPLNVKVELSPVESYRLKKYAALHGLTLEQALFRALSGCVPTLDGCVPTCEATITLGI